MAEEYQDISVEQLREYMARHEENEYLLVDVRQPNEYAGGHIPGAVLMPLGEIFERMRELPPDRDIVVYCRSGKRSRGAALLIGSRPYVAGGVFNMTGGILAWNGHLLPDGPNLRVFDLSASEQEVLMRAMELERGAESFYAAVHRRHHAAPWARAFPALAGAEQAHARMIHRFWAEGQTDPPPFAEAYAGLSDHLVEGGFSAAALVTLLESDPQHACRAILEMALTIEYAAYDLSRNMAHRFRGQPAEQVFQAIAEGEKEHISLVARALAGCSDG